MLSPVPPSGPAGELIAALTGEPDPELGYDPVTDYRKPCCPVFLRYGSEDVSVPAATSAGASRMRCGRQGRRGRRSMSIPAWSTS